ncbi:MAG: SMP-30/gluconolactonase/LRE family protein [Alphaproteobacteria bacterium]
MTALPVRVLDKRFLAIVGEAPEIDVIGDGYVFTEGPVWHPRERWLVFSDIPSSRLHVWRPARGVAVLREPTNMTNGNTLDRAGRLLCCEHATSRVTRTEADGRLTVLASHWHGKELNSPNDIVVRSDGRIYFTDPIYGREAGTGMVREPELDFRGVYRIDPDGRLVLLTDDFDQPNGLCFTPDERRLYVNDSRAGTIRLFDVDADGGLKGGRLWADVGNEPSGSPDGMKVDSQGNVYSCGPGGVHVYAPDATLLGVMLFDALVANFCFGEDDLRSLFVTVTDKVVRVCVKLPGLPVF